MNSTRWLITTASMGLLLIGCDRQSARTGQSRPRDVSVAVVPQTQPSAPATAPNAGALPPATHPAAAQPVVARLDISENYVVHAFEFPRARLHIDKDQKTAVLYSDDPKNAIDANYSGNSFYLVVPLDDEALEKLDGYVWRFKSGTSEARDSADGIFLDGQHFHLQPSDIIVAFRAKGRDMQVGISGNFFKFDTSDRVRVGTLVSVKGIVDATVDSGK